MQDIQNHKDTRNIDIDRVGVKGIRYPITVLDKENIHMGPSLDAFVFTLPLLEIYYYTRNIGSRANIKIWFDLFPVP